MPWRIDNKLTFVWTPVPSGVDQGGRLRLSVVVGPRMSEPESARGGLGHQLFKDWPSQVRQGSGSRSLLGFDVMFLPAGGGAPIKLESVPIRTDDLASSAAWKTLFPETTVKARNAVAPDELPVDDRAASYNAVAVSRQLANWRGNALLRSALREPLRRLGQAGRAAHTESWMDDLELLSSLAWTQHPRGARAQLAGGKLHLRRFVEGSHPQSHLPRRRAEKLEARNLHRLSSHPATLLRPDITDRVKVLSGALGANPNRAPTSDLDADDFLECALFHSRVPALPGVAGAEPDRSCDFAELTGLVRGYPELARRLGLLLDLRLPLSDRDRARLAGGRWRVYVTPRWEAHIDPHVRAISPSTWCQLDAGGERFMAREASADGRTPDPSHRDGHLVLHGDWRLGSADLDGGALKLINHASNQAGLVQAAFVTDAAGTVLSSNSVADHLLSSDGSTTIEGRSIHGLASIAADGGLAQVLDGMIVEGLPRRFEEHPLVFAHGGDPARPGTAKFRVVFRCDRHQQAARFEWIAVEPDAETSATDEVESPSLRSIGLALYRTSSGQDMAQAIRRQEQLMSAGGTPGEPRLVASDLILGYVPEIWAPPARHVDRPGQWFSTTARRESYPTLGVSGVPSEGHVSLGLATVRDAAPADQRDPETQGTSSPALFVYSNDSLGVAVDRESSSLPEAEEYRGTDADSGCPSPRQFVEQQVEPSSLPLVRYSHASSSPFEYAVRCRYIDVAGNSWRRPTRSLGPNDGTRLETQVARHEPVDAPRVLTDGPLDLRSNPGAGLTRLVVRRPGRNDARSLVPPRVTADLVLRYGLGLGQELKRSGGMRTIALDAYGDIPELPTIGATGAEARRLRTPVRLSSRRSRRREGYYYLPDPACKGVSIAVHTFYSRAYELPPLRAQVSFYGRRRSWPHARAVRVCLHALPVGEVAPTLRTKGLTFLVGLPMGWMGDVQLSSHLGDGAAQIASVKHIAAVAEAAEAARTLRALSGVVRGESWEARAVSVAGGVVDLRTPWRHTRLGERMQTRAGTGSALIKWGAVESALNALGAAGLEEFVASGQAPQVTPSAKMEIVAACKRPLLPPTLTINSDPREPGGEAVDLTLESRVDEKSTQELEVTAVWRRLIDDPSVGPPKIVRDRAVVSTIRLRDPVTYKPTPTSWSARLDLETERHRRVRYEISGLTRFSEFFHEASREELSCRGRGAVVIHHPNSVAPTRPVVKFAVPTRTWSSHIDPLQNQPKARFRSVAQNGIRVFLDRGWELGEMLGVVVLPTLADESARDLEAGIDPQSAPTRRVPQHLEDSVTQWGADPIVDSQLPDTLPVPEDFTGMSKVAPDLYLPPVEQDEAADPRRRVCVLGFKPHWDAERQLWYCDIGMARVPSYGAFVRLALVKFQPRSLEDRELSAPVIADFIQVRPNRIVSIMRDPEDRTRQTLRVSVSEPVTTNGGPERAKTPLVRSDGGGAGVRSQVLVHVEQECASRAPTRRRRAPPTAGWIVDPDIDVLEDAECARGVLWSGSVVWSKPVGERRLVIREFEVWPHDGGRREVFCNVLSL